MKDQDAHIGRQLVALDIGVGVSPALEWIAPEDCDMTPEQIAAHLEEEIRQIIEERLPGARWTLKPIRVSVHPRTRILRSRAEELAEWQSSMEAIREPLLEAIDQQWQERARWDSIEPSPLSLQEEAKDALRQFMSDISEEYYAAGWLTDLEYLLWEARETGPIRFGAGVVAAEQCRRLRALSDAAGGWWAWDETERSKVFIPLEEWRQRARERDGLESPAP